MTVSRDQWVSTMEKVGVERTRDCGYSPAGMCIYTRNGRNQRLGHFQSEGFVYGRKGEKPEVVVSNPVTSREGQGHISGRDKTRNIPKS